MVRFCISLVFLFFASPAMAEMIVEPDDIRLIVEVEERESVPVQDEMLLIVIRGFYKIPITLESLKQPDLKGFGWMQLGEDNWIAGTERGRRVLEFERYMALFPEKSGPITIAPFTHEFTLSEPDGTRFAYSVQSEPVEITVESKPESTAPWLPVRAVDVDDDWSNAPERLPDGGSALRKMVITVRGALPELVPEMPELTGAGVFIFPHPEHRVTQLRRSGPITRVYWRWSIRPDKGGSGYVNPLKFQYFDANSREEKSITFSAQRVAYAGAPVLENRTPTPSNPPNSAPLRQNPLAGAASALTPFAPFLGFIIGLLALPKSRKTVNFQHLKSLFHSVAGTPAERALKRAVRSGDAAATRHSAKALIAADAESGKYDNIQLNQCLESAFAPLDRAVYARSGPAVNLRKFYKDFRKSRAALLRKAP